MAEETIRVVVVPQTCDYQIVLDNAGLGRVMATLDKPWVADVLAHFLRGLPQEKLADIWERC